MKDDLIHPLLFYQQKRYQPNSNDQSLHLSEEFWVEKILRYKDSNNKFRETEVEVDQLPNAVQIYFVKLYLEENEFYKCSYAML